MAKDRVQVPGIRGNMPVVTPRATPVDTFSRAPMPVQDTRLRQLADALSDIAPGLSKYTSHQQLEVNDKDLEAGQKSATENKQRFKDAIAAGKIPAGASPWFRVGYERQKARIAGYEFDGAMKAAWQESDIKNEDNPQVVSQWMAQFTDEWQKTHPEAKDNPEWSSTFGAMAQRSQANLHSQHAAYRVQEIEREVVANTDLELGDILDSHIDLLGNRSAVTPERIAMAVDAQVANGLNGSVANQLVAKAVIRKAIEEEDVTILGLLNQVQSGSGTVGQIGFVKDMMEQAADQIASSKAHSDRLRGLQNKNLKDNQIQDYKRQGTEKMLVDPRADLTDLVFKLAQLDADEAQKLIAHQSGYLSAINAKDKIAEDPVEKTQIWIKAMNGELSHENILQAVMDGIIDDSSAKELVTTVAKAKEHKTVLTNPSVSLIGQGLVATIRGGDLEPKDSTIFRSEQARSEFMRYMLNYAAANPKASDLDLLDYSEKVSQKLIGLYRAPDAETLPQVDFNKIDPTKHPLFGSPDELRSSIEEYNTSQGKTGRLFELAELYQMDPTVLIRSQSRILPFTKGAPKK